ncbi:MAG: transposase family protein [Planctomycetota bacterium]|nr:transposase family protein [Planctomycetota bacterium]
MGRVPDPRDPSGRRFSLQGILPLTVAALLAGRQGLATVSRRGRQCSSGQLRKLGISRPKSPCHATYHNVFRALEGEVLEKALAEWTRSVLPKDAVLAMEIVAWPLVHGKQAALGRGCHAARGRMPGKA